MDKDYFQAQYQATLPRLMPTPAGQRWEGVAPGGGAEGKGQCGGEENLKQLGMLQHQQCNPSHEEGEGRLHTRKLQLHKLWCSVHYTKGTRCSSGTSDYRASNHSVNST